MSKLKTNLDEILQEKQNKIIPENIKKDIQIFDVIGTLETGIDTSSDNPITANDVVQGKEGFVNGEKITGTIYDHRGSEPPTSFATQSTSVEEITYPGSDRPILQINFDIVSSIPCVIDNTTKCNTIALGSTVAAAIGLTADKIKAGETILGITGTYTGEDDISL